MVLCTASWAQETSTSATASEETTSAARAAYNQVFDQWRKLLDELRLLQVKAREAEDAELPALKEEYAALIEKGHAMEPQLRDAAIAVYKEAPGQDREITQWLATIAKDYVEADRFEEARPAIQTLVDGNTTDPEAYVLAGTVAFALHDFEAAKQHFEKAAASGVLSRQAQVMAAEVDNYIEYWEEEKKLREHEASAPAGQELPRVRMETTKGAIVFELFENEAPETVGNFIHLVEKGFYDRLTFHHVIAGLLAQGGCPKGDGTQGPGYHIYCECHPPNTYRKHFRGSLTMAHYGQRDTGGSQFFITFVPTPQLNGQHTVFGRVVEGMEVLAKLTRRDPTKSEGLAITPDKIIQAETIRKRDHEYVPNKVKR